MFLPLFYSCTVPGIFMLLSRQKCVFSAGLPDLGALCIGLALFTGLFAFLMAIVTSLVSSTTDYCLCQTLFSSHFSVDATMQSYQLLYGCNEYTLKPSNMLPYHP